MATTTNEPGTVARTAFVDDAEAVTPDGISGRQDAANPNNRAYAPFEGSFLGEDDYQKAPELESIVDRLIMDVSEFAHLQEADVGILWKKKGGTTKGKARFGQANKPSGLLKHYAPDDFIIWIAADHVREAQLTNLQLEALVYHELRHCGFELNDDEKSPDYGETTFVLWPHDAELFISEVTRYGAWRPDLAAVRDTWAQIALDAQSGT